MKEYLLLVVSIIIFLSIFEGVLPKGKFGNKVKVIISMVVVLVILNPIVSIFNSNYDYSNSLNNSEEFTSYLNEYKKNTIEKEISSTLTLEGYNVLSVNAVVNGNENKVEIIIKKDELLTSEEHIDNLEKAKRIVIERLYLTGWEVVVA